MKGGDLFLPLYNNTKLDETSPHLHFAKTKKIAKVAPAFLKMVEGDEEETWFKMQVWMFQFLDSWFRKRTVTVLAAYTVDNAQINENRGVEAGKLAEHDETRYL
jgi:hypothetical protein